MAKQLHLPLTKEEAAQLRAGESVLLSGTIYTARDAAHKKIFESRGSDCVSGIGHRGGTEIGN